MERFEFNFTHEPSKETYGIDVCVSNSSEGFVSDELCDAFVHFMISAGFSADCVYDYFKKV